MNEVYVVSNGETSQGGGVIGVRTRLDEAEILALLQTAHFGEWELVQYDPDPGEGGTVKRWESGCDYVEIEKFTVR